MVKTLPQIDGKLIGNNKIKLGFGKKSMLHRKAPASLKYVASSRVRSRIGILIWKYRCWEWKPPHQSESTGTIWYYNYFRLWIDTQLEGSLRNFWQYNLKSLIVKLLHVPPLLIDLTYLITHMVVMLSTMYLHDYSFLLWEDYANLRKLIRFAHCKCTYDSRCIPVKACQITQQPLCDRWFFLHNPADTL